MRAFSHWNMEHDRSADALSFFQAIQNESDRCRAALPYQTRVFSYVNRGFYVEQLRRIWTYFSKSQTLILRNEELRTDPKDTLDKIYRFLGVNKISSVHEKNVHSRPYLSAMSHKEWEYLINMFEYEIQALERLLDWDCSEWLCKPDYLQANGV